MRVASAVVIVVDGRPPKSASPNKAAAVVGCVAWNISSSRHHGAATVK